MGCFYSVPYVAGPCNVIRCPLCANCNTVPIGLANYRCWACYRIFPNPCFRSAVVTTTTTTTQPQTVTTNTNNPPPVQGTPVMGQPVQGKPPPMGSPIAQGVETPVTGSPMIVQGRPPA